MCEVRWRKLLKVAAFVMFLTSIIILFEIHERFKDHFLNGLPISFKDCAFSFKTLPSKNAYCFSSEAAVWRCSMKKVVLKNFAEFTEKHLFQNLFFNKLAGLRPILTEHFRWLLLKKNICYSTVSVMFL